MINVFNDHDNNNTIFNYYNINFDFNNVQFINDFNYHEKRMLFSLTSKINDSKKEYVSEYFSINEPSLLSYLLNLKLVNNICNKSSSIEDVKISYRRKFKYAVSNVFPKRR